MSLRENVSSDMKRLNQRDWGLLIILIAPDGTVQDKDEITGEPLKTIMTNSDFVSEVPDTGEDMIVETPSAKIALTSLSVIPESSDSNWYMNLQLQPNGPLINFLVTGMRAPQGGASVGYIILYGGEVEQS
jgi:hypothetical protein